MTGFNEVHELKEKMEHAVNGHGRFGTLVGVTIATLGVLLAFCSALVSTQRSDLIATMVQQSNTNDRYQALSTRHRVLFAQLEQLHALLPDDTKYKQWDAESNKLVNEIIAPDLVKLARIIRLENAKNLNSEIPTDADLKHFAVMIKDLSVHSMAARAWSASYDEAILAHAKGAEHLELAQLAAEIGIVIASIALLFTNRFAWFCSLGLGLAAVIIAGSTYVSMTAQLNAAESKIEAAKQHFISLNSDKAEKATEERLLKLIEDEQPPVINP